MIKQHEKPESLQSKSMKSPEKYNSAISNDENFQNPVSKQAFIDGSKTTCMQAFPCVYKNH